LNNGLLVIDKQIPEVDLFTWRLGLGLAAMAVLLYGIIWDRE